MHPFKYIWANDRNHAVSSIAEAQGSKFLGGGSNLVDLMKLNIERPHTVVDINGLNLDKVETMPDGSVRIGALVSNNDVAYNGAIQNKYPLLSQAILAGASPQIRNLATTGGNLLQRTRCPYFYDTAYRCNKREPGSGCDAIKGYNRSHAILGTSNACIATHPSDMCVALAALEATIQVQSNRGERIIPFKEFHLLPGDTPNKETSLEHDELITSITLPQMSAMRYCYLKVRDRASYEFALTSAAVLLDVQGGRIAKARVALGGIGTKPWRSADAERILEGSKPARATYQAAAHAALKDAKGYEHNSFKIELAKRTLISALETAEGNI